MQSPFPLLPARPCVGARRAPPASSAPAGARARRADEGDQDRRVLRLIALGVQTWRIAEELSRGVKAVEKYRAGLMQRFGLKNAAAVTRFALEMHLLSRQEVDRMLTPSTPPPTDSTESRPPPS